MKIVIVGCGYVGGALAARARAEGHDVWGLRRGSTSPPASGVRMVRGDVTHGRGLSELPRGADALVYAVSPGERTEAAYRLAYPEGVRRVFEQASFARFVLVSSTAVYGEASGGLVDDRTPVEPRSVTAAQIVAAEELVLTNHPSAVVLRASGIYGPGRQSLLERVRRGTAITPDEPVYTNRIHRDDLAGILLFLLQRPELSGCFLATDTEPVELGELQAWLAGRLGVPEPPRAPREEGTTRHRRSKRCVPRRLLEAGYRFEYPTFREGYAALLQDVR